MFSGGIRVKVVSSGDFTVGERALAVSPILSSSRCRWRGATLWGLASFHHHLTSRIFITQPGCSPPPVVIQKDDYQPCGGGRSKPGCGLPPALSFKDVHHPCWGGGCVELGPASAWVAARFFPQCSGEKGVRRLWRCQLPRVWLPGLGGSGAASGAAPYRWAGAWLPVRRTGDGRAVRGLATSTASPTAPVVLGGRTRRRTPCGWGRRSWMVLSSLP